MSHGNYVLSKYLGQPATSGDNPLDSQTVDELATITEDKKTLPLLIRAMNCYQAENMNRNVVRVAWELAEYYSKLDNQDKAESYRRIVIQKCKN